MINKFGKVMIYVNDPQTNARFWVDKIGFTEVKTQKIDDKVFCVELAINYNTDAHIVLLDKAIVQKMSPELHFGTPSILFSSQDIVSMRVRLASLGVKVGDVVEIGSSKTFNFADNEGNYFAVEENK